MVCPVDKIRQRKGCGLRKNYPQSAVYDISRINSGFSKVFHNFPKYYYDDKNLSFIF